MEPSQCKHDLRPRGTGVRKSGFILRWPFDVGHNPRDNYLQALQKFPDQLKEWRLKIRLE